MSAAEIVSAAVLALSDAQLALLRSAALSTEMFAPNLAVLRALRRRGLVTVKYIGQRWWTIRLTKLGRDHLAGQVQP